MPFFSSLFDVDDEIKLKDTCWQIDFPLNMLIQAFRKTRFWHPKRISWLRSEDWEENWFSTSFSFLLQLFSREMSNFSPLFSWHNALCWNLVYFLLFFAIFLSLSPFPFLLPSEPAYVCHSCLIFVMEMIKVLFCFGLFHLSPRSFLGW